MTFDISRDIRRVNENVNMTMHLHQLLACCPGARHSEPCSERSMCPYNLHAANGLFVELEKCTNMHSSN